MGLYTVIRNLLFLIEPEKVHYLTVDMIKICLKIPGASNIIRSDVKGVERLAKTVAGLRILIQTYPDIEIELTKIIDEINDEKNN